MAWITQQDPQGWVYTQTPIKRRDGDTATAAVRGANGRIEANAAASGPDQSSAAEAAHNGTFTATRKWQGPPAAPAEETVTIRVNYTAKWATTVTAQEPGSATASVHAVIRVTVKQTGHADGTPAQETLFDKTFSTQPSSSHSRDLDTEPAIDTGAIKHTGDLEYTVSISVRATASRTGEGSSASATAIIDSTTVTLT